VWYTFLRSLYTQPQTKPKTNPRYRIPPHLELNPVPGKPKRKQNFTELSHSFFGLLAFSPVLAASNSETYYGHYIPVRYQISPKSHFKMATCPLLRVIHSFHIQNMSRTNFQVQRSDPSSLQFIRSKCLHPLQPPLHPFPSSQHSTATERNTSKSLSPSHLLYSF
jgi:hypothetical protein